MISCEIGLETERTRDNMTDTNTFHKLSLLFSVKKKEKEKMKPYLDVLYLL